MGYQWIKEDIKIDFSLPKNLEELIKEMEEMDKNDDYGYFEFFSLLDIAVKELVRQGKLSRKQWDLLFEKYCGV